jgi:hypothetical protein
MYEHQKIIFIKFMFVICICAIGVFTSYFFPASSPTPFPGPVTSLSFSSTYDEWNRAADEVKKEYVNSFASNIEDEYKQAEKPSDTTYIFTKTRWNAK